MFSTGTSLLPRFPLERHSFHVCEDVCRNCHVNVGLATLMSLLPCFPLERLSCHVCEDVCRNFHVNVALATLTSLLPHFPLERRSCHIFHWNVTLATFVKMYVTIATLTLVLPLFPLERLSCHVCENVCHNCDVCETRFSPPTVTLVCSPSQNTNGHLGLFYVGIAMLQNI